MASISAYDTELSTSSTTVPANTEAMAEEPHVNGDTSLHEPAPSNLETSESSHSSELPLKQQTPSNTSQIQDPVAEQASERVLEPVKEATPPVLVEHETVTDVDNSDMPVATATAIVETVEPALVSEKVILSPETKIETAEPLEVANDIGQPVISDERSAPIETAETIIETPAMQTVPVETAPILMAEEPVHPLDQLESIPPPPVTSEIIDTPTVPPAGIAMDVPKPATIAETITATGEEKMEDVVPTGIVIDSGKIAREREEDEEDAAGPEAKRTKMEVNIEPEPAVENGVPQIETPAAVDDPTAQAPIVDTAMEGITNDDSAIAATPVGDAAAAVVDAAAAGASAAQAADAAASVNWGPLTDAQSKQLRQLLANLKKGKHAHSFAKPVDAVALKIPTYHDIITTPMDLSTMEQKLKEAKYTSVNEFVDDFNLIVDNCLKFNGPSHAVSIAVLNLKAQFGGGLKKVPKAGEVVEPAPKKQRKSSFSLPQRETKRRESRPSVGTAASPTAATPNQTFALGQNGVPLTRRISNTDGRPKREIQKPPPRDLPYDGVKPKKKKFQTELKYCEVVLGEMKRGRYGEWMTPFASPVDPVALNIPDYHKYIKKPMDFRTITEKLNGNHYENAKEFESDVKLVFSNCYKFNGPNHPITQAGKALEQVFDDLWSRKQTWVSNHEPASAPQSPGAESDSEAAEEEDEDEEDDEDDQRAQQIASLQKQIAELSAQAVALTSTEPSKKAKTGKKKDKSKKPGATPAKTSKKTGSSAAPTAKKQQPPKKTKAKPAPKLKPLTMKDKAEIAERIGELSSEDTAKAAEFIKEGLRRIDSPLADAPDDELEFEIEQIPDDVLRNLLKLVRKNDPPETAQESRPAAPTPSAKSRSASKPKKNKPMGKHEQEDAIRRLTNQIENFQNPNAAGASVDTKEETSGDEDDSGSESEEE